MDWRNRVLRGAATGLLALMFSGPLVSAEAAEDFLRGDANSDGSVSISDAHALFNSLFRFGGRLDCEKAGDFDDSGRVNLTDGVRLLMFLVEREEAPAAPFPEVGADGTDDDLDCGSYGGGSPIGDPAAALAVSFSEAPGGDVDFVTVTVRLSSSAPIGGYFGAVDHGGVIAWAGDPVDLTGTLDRGYSYAGLAGETLYFGLLSSIADESPMPAGEDVPVLEFQICLLEGSVAGTYPLAPVHGELADYGSGRAIDPAFQVDPLELESDLSESAGCPEGWSGEPPDGPGDIQVVFRLEDAVASRGQSVMVPFLTDANAEIQGLAFSLDFDEEVLIATDVEQLFQKPDGSEWGFWSLDIDNHNATPGNGGVDEGFIAGAGVLSLLDSNNNIPVGTAEVLGFHFTVRDDAPLGETVVRFEDGGQGRGQPVENIVTAFGVSIRPEEAKSFVFISGVMNVVADTTLFRRGDANGDRSIDVSDAQFTLNYLFLGGDAPRCFDAADANDDGQLDIADPVRVLQFLFLGSGSLPEPHPDAGTDPTADGLSCTMVP